MINTYSRSTRNLTWSVFAALLSSALVCSSQTGGNGSLSLSMEPVFVAEGPPPGQNPFTIVHNVDAADTTNTDQIWSGSELNLSGAGVTVGIWDGGAVRATHQELTGRVSVIEDVGVSDHATHVAGTIGATGVDAAARGMASNVMIRSRDFNSDKAELAADAAVIDISNHSYGQIRGWTTHLDWGTDIGPVDTWFADRSLYDTEDPWFGSYQSGAADLDQVLYNNPHLTSVWSAGNDRSDRFTNIRGDGMYMTYLSNGPEGSAYYLVSTADFAAPAGDGNAGTGYDSLPGDQTALNSIVVGAVNDVLADPYSANDVSQTSFSSWGPTDDGRLGVDIVANGAGLYSSIAGSDTAYGTYSGTSMAAPNATGTIALLLEYYRLQHGRDPNSATMRSLVTHTATDVGNTGPDYANGYGLLNGATAADFIANSALSGSNHYLAESTYFGSAWSTEFTVDGNSPLRATLAWLDPYGGTLQSGLDDTTSMLDHNLDLWMSGPGGTTFLPWSLDPANPTALATQDAPNNLDNLEQVYITDPAPGTYTLYVGGAEVTEDFSLLVSGGLHVPEPTGLLLLLGGMALAFTARPRRLG